MRCEKAREIILTDYIDGCLARYIETQLESHIKDCPECQEFRALILKSLSVPFAQLPREKMPELVVRAVMEQVRTNKVAHEGMVLQRFWEGIRSVVFPNLLIGKFAVVVLTVLVISGISIRINNIHLAKQNERVLYLALIAELPSINDKVVGSYGTSMESFLF